MYMYIMYMYMYSLDMATTQTKPLPPAARRRRPHKNMWRRRQSTGHWRGIYFCGKTFCKERCGRMERYLFGKTYSNRLYLELISLEFSRCLQQDAGCIHRIHAIIFQIYKLIAIRILKGILLE